MKEKEYYTIGELSKLYHLPISTLRYYHRCGLFEPEYCDPANGYRYYSRDQLYRLDVLGLLRVLEIPVADISELSTQPDFDNAILGYLDGHKSALQAQMDALQAKIDIVNSILTETDRKINFREEDEEITLRHLPARTLLLSEVNRQISDERAFRTYMQEMFGTPLTEPNLPLLIRGNGMTSSLEYLLRSGRVIYDGAYMEPDSPYGSGNWTEMRLPEGDCLTLRFPGNENARAAAYARMADYIRANGVETSDMMMEHMLWSGIMSSKKGSDVMELRVMLK